jgi:DNA-binding transcriptional MerR regulator
MVVRLPTAGAASHSLEAAARLAGLHPEMLRHYCRIGLLGEARAQPGDEPVFDDDAVFELRRFEHYRRHHGLDRRSLRLLCRLWREIEQLRAEVRFLRGP